MLIKWWYSAYGEFTEMLEEEKDELSGVREVELPEGLWDKYEEAKEIWLELQSEIFSAYEDAE